jgi:hypothetical protein
MCGYNGLVDRKRAFVNPCGNESTEASSDHQVVIRSDPPGLPMIADILIRCRYVSSDGRNVRNLVNLCSRCTTLGVGEVFPQEPGVGRNGVVILSFFVPSYNA